MPSPKYKKKDYAVIRDDNTYVVYTWAKEDFEEVSAAIIAGSKFVFLKMGIIGLKDVRAIVEQKPEDKKKETVKQLESGTPDVDVMTFEYLKKQEKEIQEWLQEHPEYDDEVEGGRFS